MNTLVKVIYSSIISKSLYLGLKIGPYNNKKKSTKKDYCSSSIWQERKMWRHIFNLLIILVFLDIFSWSFILTHFVQHVVLWKKYITSGRKWLLTFTLGSQPLGREIPSWYSAASQRVKGVFAAPQRVFSLREKNSFFSFVFFVMYLGVPGTTCACLWHACKHYWKGMHSNQPHLISAFVFYAMQWKNTTRLW